VVSAAVVSAAVVDAAVVAAVIGAAAMAPAVEAAPMAAAMESAAVSAAMSGADLRRGQRGRRSAVEGRDRQGLGDARRDQQRSGESRGRLQVLAHDRPFIGIHGTGGRNSTGLPEGRRADWRKLHFRSTVTALIRPSNANGARSK
jgi:hypothetical protein